MAKFKIEIGTDNEAFGDNPGHEMGLILRGIAQRVERSMEVGRYFTVPIVDTNGNTCGKYIFTK